MTDTLDCIVIGAGVVGLAIARRMAMSGQQVVVLEAEERIGAHTSSRNSEVIHAGIYYDAGSLKARLCVAGKSALYAYCRKKRVPYGRTGKLIVATGSDEEASLGRIHSAAGSNGVHDLRWLTQKQIAGLCSRVYGTAGLFSPSTGIVDSHALMLSLQGDLEGNDGMVLLRHRVHRVDVDAGGFSIRCTNDRNTPVRCRMLINSAGLWAHSVARRISGVAENQIPTGYFAIGHYFSYSGPSPFQHLIYPVPIVGGLGIHATNDLQGLARFGPDAEWIDDIDYTFQENKKLKFVEAIRRYFPDIEPRKLRPSYTGIRPKLYRPGEASADFQIQGSEAHGIPGLVNLFGIESPGLTSCLAIADHVCDRLH